MHMDSHLVSEYNIHFTNPNLVVSVNCERVDLQIQCLINTLFIELEISETDKWGNEKLDNVVTREPVKVKTP